MFEIKKRMSRFENHVDSLIAAFVFRHRILGLFLIFVGMPLFTLAAVCSCTAILAMPLALLFGWT